MSAEHQWQVVGSSVIGTSHLTAGIPCQDANAHEVLDEWIIGAVADGAGSATHAEVGSALAVTTALSCTRNYLTASDKLAPSVRQLVLDVFTQTRLTLESKALAMESVPGDLATTLILFVASNRFLCVGQIGDGAVVVISKSGHLTAIAAPAKGEYVNETTFLTSTGMQNNIHITLIEEEFEGIMAFSDGLQFLALKFPDMIPFEGFCRPLFHFARDESQADATKKLDEFLRSERVNSRTDDDKTLLIAVR